MLAEGAGPERPEYCRRHEGAQQGSCASEFERRCGRVVRALGHCRVCLHRCRLLAAYLRSAASGTERASALAAGLLERHPVLTRDAVAAEGVPGGFSAVYPVLKAMEEAGRARRGYFVEGLGGAQFALPGAVERLRALRGEEPEDTEVTLAATDPANPYGAVLAWPTPTRPGGHGPRRVAGAHIVLRNGDLLAYLEKGGRSLLTFPPADPAVAAEPDPAEERRRHEHTARALASLVHERRVDRLRLSKVDGEDVGAHPLLEPLRAVGFVDDPRGLVLRG